MFSTLSDLRAQVLTAHAGEMDMGEYNQLAVELGTFPPLSEAELQEALLQVRRNRVFVGRYFAALSPVLCNSWTTARMERFRSKSSGVGG